MSRQLILTAKWTDDDSSIYKIVDSPTILNQLYNRGQYNYHMQIMSVQLLFGDHSTLYFTTLQDRLRCRLSSQQEGIVEGDLNCFADFYFFQGETGNLPSDFPNNNNLLIDYSDGIDRGMVYTSPKIYFYCNWKSNDAKERYVKIKIIYNLVRTSARKAINYIKEK